MCSENFTNTGLIIIFDDSEFLNKKEEVLFKAMERSLIAALQQKAAPILVSFSVLRSIVMHRDLLKILGNFTQELDLWIYKKVSDFLYLLVPKNYHDISALKNYSQMNIAKSEAFTPLELALGLKIDHMHSVNWREIEKTLYLPPWSETLEKDFINNLPNIFLSNQDYSKVKMLAQRPAWALYMTGHGDILKQASRKSILSKQELMEGYIFLQKAQQEWQLFLEKEKQIKNVQEQATLLANAELSLKKAVDIFKKFKDINISMLKFDQLKSVQDSHVLELEKKEFVRCFENAVYVFKVDEMFIFSQENFAQGIYNIFAYLTTPNFQKLLAFLDTKIRTKIFCFDSCFSGGGLDRLYEDQKKAIQKIYNYLIVTAASTDAPSLMSIRMLQFNEFFSALRTHDPIDFEEVLNYIFGFYYQEKKLIRFPQNLPLLKFPGREWVSMIDIPEKIVSLGKTLARSRNPNQPLDVSRFFAGRITKEGHKKLSMIYPQMVLFYTDKIPFILKFTAPPTKTDEAIFPTFFSMISGDAVHELAGVDAADFGLWDIVISGFDESDSRKIFMIKELTVKNDITNWPGKKPGQLLKLTDVILFYSVKNPRDIQIKGEIHGIYFTLNGTYYRSWWKKKMTDFSGDTLQNFAMVKDDYMPAFLEFAASIRSQKASKPDSVFNENLEELKKFMEIKPKEKPKKPLPQESQEIESLQKQLQELQKTLNSLQQKIS